MLFEEKLKELRTLQQLPQFKLAAALGRNTATDCKVEKDERKAKREQVVILSDFLNVKDDSQVALWLTDRVASVVSNDTAIAQGSLYIVTTTI